MAAEFNLVHFSDLHLSSIPGAKGLLDAGFINFVRHLIATKTRPGRRHFVGTYSDVDLLAFTKGLEKSIERRREPFDFFVVTGDLATIGEALDLEIARNFLDGHALIECQNGKPKYAPSFVFDPDKRVVLPGNHDRYSGTFLFPGGQHFEGERAFGESWGQASPVGCSSSRIRVAQSTKDGETLFVIAADFSHFAPSIRRKEWWAPWYWLPPSWLGKGTVDSKTLEALSHVTRECQKTGAVIWALHYPIYMHGVPWKYRPYGIKKLSKKALELGVRFVLSGHTHLPCHNQVVYPPRRYCFFSRDRSRSVRAISAGSVSAYDDSQKSYYELCFKVNKGSIVSVDLNRFAAQETSSGRQFSSAEVEYY